MGNVSFGRSRVAQAQFGEKTLGGTPFGSRVRFLTFSSCQQTDVTKCSLLSGLDGESQTDGFGYGY
jgi:hypothetical protein